MLSLSLCIALLTLAQTPAAPLVEKFTVPLRDLERQVDAELFETGFLEGDSNYHAILAASDGRIHFVVNTHDPLLGCRYFAFDPRSEKVELLGKLDEALGEPAAEWIPQGKVHVPLYEHRGRIWFATHTSYYDGEVPRRDTGGRKPYAGGHFACYDLGEERFIDLVTAMPGEGIITMLMDKDRETLYGLTWPSGILVTYDIRGEELRYWGAVQGRGEWGQHPHEWDRICRTLGLDPEGYVYGSTMDGRIWRFDRTQPRPVSYLDGIDLSRVSYAQSTQATLKGDFQHNWRVIVWNPATDSFWGIVWETTALFEFIPSAGYLRTVADLRPAPYRAMPRNPEISQLGFTLGPGNRLFYLAHGPAVEVPGRPAAQSALHLLTYDIDDGRLTDHGPILGPDNRRVFFSESIAIGPDNRIYTVAWVEVVDPDRIAAIREARRAGPAETQSMVYEIMLVRLPVP